MYGCIENVFKDTKMCIFSFKRPQACRSQRPKPDWPQPSGYLVFSAPDGTDSAAGAVALRLMICIGYGMERYRPPRRTGSSADTSKGP
ncbi:MAG: hypothetical protein CME99_06900, partial [Hyphomonas sp.]